MRELLVTAWLRATARKRPFEEYRRRHPEPSLLVCELSPAPEVLVSSVSVDQEAVNGRQPKCLVWKSCLSQCSELRLLRGWFSLSSSWILCTIVCRSSPHCKCKCLNWTWPLDVIWGQAIVRLTASPRTWTEETTASSFRDQQLGSTFSTCSC